jgi:hypothetical protein
VGLLGWVAEHESGTVDRSPCTIQAVGHEPLDLPSQHERPHRHRAVDLRRPLERGDLGCNQCKGAKDHVPSYRGLAFSRQDIDMNYVVEPGEFEVMVGTSSREEDLRTVILRVAD